MRPQALAIALAACAVANAPQALAVCYTLYDSDGSQLRSGPTAFLDVSASNSAVSRDLEALRAKGQHLVFSPDRACPESSAPPAATQRKGAGSGAAEPPQPSPTAVQVTASLAAPTTGAPAAPATAGSAVEALRNLSSRLAKGEAQALWDSLPPRYQQDINNLVRTYGQNVDPLVYDKGMGTLRKGARLLREKKEYILNQPALVKGPASAKADLAKARAVWDPVIGGLESLFNDLSSVQKLREFNGRSFLERAGTNLLEMVNQMAQVAGEPNPFVKLAGAEIKPAGTKGNVQLLDVSMDGKTERVEMVQVDGAWVSKKLADSWDNDIRKAMAKARDFKQSGKDTAGFVMVLGMVDATFDQLLAAKSQQEFDSVVQGIMNMGAMGASGGLSAKVPPMAAAPKP